MGDDKSWANKRMSKNMKRKLWNEMPMVDFEKLWKSPENLEGQDFPRAGCLPRAVPCLGEAPASPLIDDVVLCEQESKIKEEF